MHKAGKTKSDRVTVEAVGGRLEVKFNANGSYTDVFLIGPAEQVFKGTIEC
jgi:diaminopimelate epimerase